MLAKLVADADLAAGLGESNRLETQLRVNLLLALQHHLAHLAQFELPFASLTGSGFPLQVRLTVQRPLVLAQPMDRNVAILLSRQGVADGYLFDDRPVDYPLDLRLDEGGFGNHTDDQSHVLGERQLFVADLKNNLLVLDHRGEFEHHLHDDLLFIGLGLRLLELFGVVAQLDHFVDGEFGADCGVFRQ